jgi:farnesyl diphosphate synthase
VSNQVSETQPSAAPRGDAAFAARIQAFRQRIEVVLDRALELPDPGTPPRLREAMRYSVLGAGKRLRPTLVYLTGESLGAPLTVLDVPAAAVELIHVYSLVHDDLPAMDDDDMRRGRPTCHRAFDEGTAVLVGDALQALGFAVLASESMEGTPDWARLEMLRVLARAIGTGGMAGGQAIDLAAVGQNLSVGAVEDMHRRKTGALIECSVLLGALAAGVGGGEKLAALKRFGAEIGLAFQIQDDILDVEGDPALLGKSIGADAAHAKPTYPSTAGLAASRVRAAQLRDAAITALALLGERGAPLAQLADFMVSRAS